MVGHDVMICEVFYGLHGMCLCICSLDSGKEKWSLVDRWLQRAWMHLSTGTEGQLVTAGAERSSCLQVSIDQYTTVRWLVCNGCPRKGCWGYWGYVWLSLVVYVECSSAGYGPRFNAEDRRGVEKPNQNLRPLVTQTSKCQSQMLSLRLCKSTLHKKK